MSRGFYNYDTRGASAASQIINLERMLEARDAEIERLLEALKKYGQHRSDCAVVLGGYQCTCGFNQHEQPR